MSNLLLLAKATLTSIMAVVDDNQGLTICFRANHLVNEAHGLEMHDKCTQSARADLSKLIPHIRKLAAEQGIAIVPVTKNLFDAFRSKSNAPWFVLPSSEEHRYTKENAERFVRRGSAQAWGIVAIGPNEEDHQLLVTFNENGRNQAEGFNRSMTERLECQQEAGLITSDVAQRLTPSTTKPQMPKSEVLHIEQD